MKSKLLFLFMYVVFPSSAISSECNEILGYIRDSTSITSSNYSESNFKRFFCENIHSTYEKAKDSSFNVGIDLDDMPISIGGSSKRNSWSSYQKNVCEMVNKGTLTSSKWKVSIAKANNAVTAAWENCITSQGLHLWAEVGHDPSLLVIKTKYISSGTPYVTTSNGAINFQPNNAIECIGDDIKKNTKIDSAGLVLNCQRKNKNSITATISTTQGVADIKIPSIQPKPIQPITPSLTIKTFTSTGSSAAHPRAEVTVPNGYKIIGGGAKVNWSGNGNLITSIYPASITKWVATSKDHKHASPANITVYAVAIYDPENEWDVQVFSSSSSPAQHPRVSANVPDSFLLTGGGARVLWSGYGNLLTASYPSGKHTWEARSKDHDHLSPAAITAYAIGIRPRNGAELPESHIFTSTSGVTAHPSHSMKIDNNYVLTGGGALDNWGGYGNLLTSSYPVSSSSWAASGKDHNVSDPSAITVYAIGVKP